MQLQSIDEESFSFRNDAEKLRRAINAEIAAYLDRQAKFDAELDELKQSSASGLGVKHLRSAEKLTVDRVALLREKLRLATRLLDEWCPVVIEEKKRAHRESVAAFSKTSERVTRQLGEIGFEAGKIAGISIPWVVNQHPAVRQAWTVSESLRCRSAAAQIEQFEEAVKSIQAEVDAATAKAVAVD